MVALTEESLNKLNKPDSGAIVIGLQNKMDSLNHKLAEKNNEANEIKF